MGQNLSNTVAEYLLSCATLGDRPSTIRNKRITLDHFITVIGNIQTRNVTPQHIDIFFAAMQARGHVAGTLNNHLTALRGFFRWCAERRYRALGDDPTRGRRVFKIRERRRLMVPRQDFGRLLDAAPHPRDRMVLALGLYLFLRQSEIAGLRIGDVDLNGATVHVTVYKTGRVDAMPISEELDAELRRWLSWYAVDSGPLQPGWYLCPAKTPPRFRGVPGFRNLVPVADEPKSLRPERRMTKVETIAQRALMAAGFAIRDENDKSTMEGMHTLRRSGARALFDDLVDNRGHDGAGRLVQAMLHHKSFSTTEIYLQIDLDRRRRDEVLRGRPMFTKPDPSNVIELRKEVVVGGVREGGGVPALPDARQADHQVSDRDIGDVVPTSTVRRLREGPVLGAAGSAPGAPRGAQRTDDHGGGRGSQEGVRAQEAPDGAKGRLDDAVQPRP